MFARRLKHNNTETPPWANTMLKDLNYPRGLTLNGMKMIVGLARGWRYYGQILNITPNAVRIVEIDPDPSIVCIVYTKDGSKHTLGREYIELATDLINEFRAESDKLVWDEIK